MPIPFAEFLAGSRAAVAAVESPRTRSCHSL